MDPQKANTSTPGASAGVPNSSTDNGSAPSNTASTPNGSAAALTTARPVSTPSPEPQPTAPPAAAPSVPTPPPAQPKKSNGLVAIACLCAILGLAGVAFGVYGMFFQNKPTSENTATTTEPTTTPSNPTEEQKTYQLSDYVSFSDVAVPVTFPDEVSKGHTEDIVKKIELKILPANIVSSFNSSQEELIARADGSIMSQSNETGASINDGILSVYTVFSYQGVYGKTGDAETLNYNLDTENILSNNELVNLYDLTSAQVYEAVLKQIANSVTTNSFLLSTTGDVTAPSISVTDFANNIAEYKTTLPSNLDLVKLYLDNNGKIHALYQQYQILEALGMGTHMGIGLLPGVQDVSL